MLTVTDAALSQLLRAIGQAQNDESPDACFRIVPRNGASLGLAFQAPEPMDRTFQHEGKTILAMPENILDAFEDGVLDLDRDGQLVLRQ